MSNYEAKQRRFNICHRCREAIHVGDVVEAKRHSSGTKHYHAACYDRMHH